jgi:gliding motility-associated-like protein
MKKLLSLSLSILLSLLIFSQKNNYNVLTNVTVIPEVSHGITVELRSYIEDPNAVNEITKTEKIGYHPKSDWILNENVNPNALPVGQDPAHQTNYNNSGSTRALNQSFEGIGNTAVSPADPSVDVGPTYVIQMINGGSGSYFKIFNKTGGTVVNQTYFDNFFGMPGGAGDPIVLYDELAGRWLMSEFSSTGNNLHVAVSTTGDPLGTWNTYTFNAPNFPDYPKYSIWNDAYILTTNENTAAVYALDRASMLTGAAATSQRFSVPTFGTIGFQAMTPVSLNGTTLPPTGAPAMVMRMRDDAWNGSASDALEIWEFNIDWANPANTSLIQTATLGVSPFDSELCGFTSFACIPQPGSGTTLDPLREVLMNRIHYRNFNTHESIVCCHVTDVNGSDLAGIRWYELRRTGGNSGTWSIYQEGTYSPDSDNRWMGSIGISATGQIGLAYNVSSSSTFPSLRYTGRKECDPLGVMTEPETVIIDGTASNNSNRYGDYNAIGLDPTDGESFWFTGMYNPATSWSTRIASFTIPSCSPLVQFNASTYTVDEPNADVINGCLDYYILTVPIQIGSDPSQPADVTVNVSGGTATQGIDYQINNFTHTLDGSTLIGNVELWIYNDDYVEGTETIILDYTLNANGGDATAGSFNQTTTITINDDDLDPISMTNSVTVFTEDFETGMNGFTSTNPSGDTPWQVADVATAASQFYAIPTTNNTDFLYINDDDCNCDQNDVDVLFPSVDLSNYLGATLNMDTYFENNNYQGNQETAELRVSIGGGPFNAVTSIIASPLDIDWTNQTIDLTPYVGNANVQLAINYSDGTGWLYGCSIDNVLISGTVPIGIQTTVNIGTSQTANLGANQTVHFYDPASKNVMVSLENTSSFDYGCVTVDVDRDGSSPTALEFASANVPDYLHSKTFTITPTNNNPSGTFNVMLYYEEAEVSAWEVFTGNLRTDAEIIKVAGTNSINDVTPANFATYTIDNVLASLGTFNSDVTFSAPFSNGFSGFGVGIYNPNPTVVTHTSVDIAPLCNGSSDGTIVITAAGGTPSYQYSIDGGTTFQSSDTFSNLPSGTYNVIVEDALNNQSAVSTVTLQDPAPLSLSSSNSAPLCNGDSNGSITITASGGTGTLQYSIDGGTTFQASATFTNLIAGNYSIMVQDVNGCQITSSENLIDPTILSFSASSTDENCAAVDGSLTINASGGTGLLQYSIDGGTLQSSNIFNSLVAGTYSVLVQDANGCQTTSIENVNSAGGISLNNLSAINPTCNGANDGIINITATGGSGTLTYSINGGSSFQNSGFFTGLAGNTYSVIVQDVNLCQVTSSITLTEPSNITFSSILSQPLCNGDNNGSIEINATGGTGSLQYSVDGGVTFQSSSLFSNLTAGSYSILIEDANSCQQSGTISLNDPNALTYSATITNETCSNSNGSITITASGGTGALQYSIDGGVNFQNSANFTGLPGFNYNIIIEDVNGCQLSGSETIINENAPAITSINTTDPLCFGDDGIIIIQISGGTGTMQYSIDGGITFGGSPSFTAQAGNYSIVVEDGNGCQTNSSTTINEPQAISFTSTVTNENCGVVDGSITINGSGGTGAFIYSIDAGISFQSNNLFNGLTSGTYNLVVEDANGCQAANTENVGGSGGSVVNNITTASPSCNSGNDGEITINASGGTAPLLYSIDGGTSFQSSNSFTTVAAGSYVIVVQDDSGCQTFDNTSITDPILITYSSSSNDETCGSSDGSISIFANGGSGSYQFSIDGGLTLQSSGIFTGLNAGIYSIVIEDANGCQVAGIETIGSTGGATITNSSSTDPNCYGENTGSINITANGGTGTLNYSIDGGITFQSSGLFSNLNGGTYTVLVEDANGCQTFSSINIIEPAELISIISIVEATCGTANGSATATAGGGTGNISYQWDDPNNQTTATASNLFAGIYHLTLTDDNGCILQDSALISNLGDPAIIVSSTNVICFGDNNGTASATAIGGIIPYSYLWNDPNNQTTSTATGLSSGTYLIQVTDDVGCIAFETVSISEPLELINSSSIINTSCGMNNGLAISNIQGGTQPYTFSWDDPNNQTSPTAVNLNSGNYNLTVIDDNNCSLINSVSILNSDSLIVNVDVTHETCEGQADGSIITFVSQGNSPFNYLWSTGDTTSFLNGLSAGEYMLNVSDSLDCSAILIIPIETDNQVCIVIPTAISPNGDGSNDDWIISGTEININISVEIYNRWGGLLYANEDYQNNWNGTYKEKSLSAGVYYFIVKVDQDKVYTGSLTIIR